MPDLKLFFDKAELGNSHAEQNEGHRAGNLHGKIDELVFFRKPLDMEEIEQLYEIGRPFALPRLSPTLP